ncbi:hypothetical protein FB451DRAFT_1572074 [Mycena latifolia]|nr:hypothetical protein FB451DRAFT_1572074 [Mycena latifolia]
MFTRRCFACNKNEAGRKCVSTRRESLVRISIDPVNFPCAYTSSTGPPRIRPRKANAGRVCGAEREREDGHTPSNDQFLPGPHSIIPSEDDIRTRRAPPDASSPMPTHVLGIYQYWRPQVPRYAASRPSPPSASPLPHTLASLVSARRGSNPKSRYRRAPLRRGVPPRRAACDRRRAQRAREDGEAAARAEALALTADLQLPAGKLARASSNEMRCTVGRERDIRVRRGERLGCCAKEVEEKDARVELASAVGSGKSWTMQGGSEETQGIIPRCGAVAQVSRGAEELKDRGNTYTMEGQVLEICKRR